MAIPPPQHECSIDSSRTARMGDMRRISMVTIPTAATAAAAAVASGWDECRVRSTVIRGGEINGNRRLLRGLPWHVCVRARQ